MKQLANEAVRAGERTLRHELLAIPLTRRRKGTPGWSKKQKQQAGKGGSVGAAEQQQLSEQQNSSSSAPPSPVSIKSQAAEGSDSHKLRRRTRSSAIRHRLNPLPTMAARAPPPSSGGSLHNKWNEPSITTIPSPLALDQDSPVGLTLDQGCGGGDKEAVPLGPARLRDDPAAARAAACLCECLG